MVDLNRSKCGMKVDKILILKHFIQKKASKVAKY